MSQDFKYFFLVNAIQNKLLVIEYFGHLNYASLGQIKLQ